MIFLTILESAPGVLFDPWNDDLSRAGSRRAPNLPLRAELAQVAAEFNMLSVPVLSPGSLRLRLTDGDSHARSVYLQLVGSRPSNGRMVRALIEEIALAYGVDTSRIRLAGGAEFLATSCCHTILELDREAALNLYRWRRR